MDMATTLIIFGGGHGSGCHGPNCGRPRSDTGVAFVSPNTQENLNLANAMDALHSPEHRAFRQLAQQVMTAVHLGGVVRDTIGDWSDGVENSLLLRVKTKDYDTTRYVAAALGLRASQKSVLPFMPAKNGPDSLYEFTVPHRGNIEGVRQQLSKMGIAFRTLEPKGDSLSVRVFDKGSSMVNAVGKVGEHYGISIKTIRGAGEIIGGETKEAGREAFQKITRDFEARHPRLARKLS